MNRTPDTDQLLRDVLSEGEPPGSMESMLAETLRLVRRRRVFRRARNISACLALVAICAFLTFRNVTKYHHGPAWTEESFAEIRTHPLDAGSIIRTRPLYESRVISSVYSVAIIRTSREKFRVINDHELLALVSPRPAILIRLGAASEQLKFVGPEDGKTIHVE